MRRVIGQHDAAAGGDPGAGPISKQSSFRQAGNRPEVGGASADRGGSLREIGGVGFLLSHAEEFELNDEQQDNLRKLRLPFELEKVDRLAALQKARITWRALVHDPNAPEHDVLKAIENVAACEADLRRMRYYHLKSARSHLNDEQSRLIVRQARRRRLEARGDPR